MNAPASGPGLKLALKLEAEALTVNIMPPEPRPKPFKLALEVTWPWRSIWQGVCPTALTADFWVDYQGKTIWRWSQGQTFAQVETPVEIPGAAPVSFPVIWMVDPQVVYHEGIYTVHAVFVASQQVVGCPLRILVVT